MKPVGLTNPNDPTVKAYAIVQLRQDNKLGTLYNMVGFQTKLKYGPQQQIFRTIPGLQNAEFARLGGLHRNTFLNSPKLLDGQLRLRAQPRLRFAGQMTGCEGYVESASIGLIAGLYAAADARQQSLAPPPPTTALGSLLGHITGGHIETIDAGPRSFQPMNINFGLFPPLANPPTRKPDGTPAARQRKDRRQEAGAQRPRAGRSRSLDRRSSARAGGGVRPVRRPGRGAALFMPLSQMPGPRFRPSQTGPALQRTASQVLRTALRPGTKVRDARHSVHNVRNRDVTRGVNRLLSARDIRLRSRRTSASGRNSGRTSGGALAKQLKRGFQMPARLADELIQRRAQLRRLLAREHLFHAAAVALQQLQRHEQLPPRCIDRQCRDHPHQALRRSLRGARDDRSPRIAAP